MSENKCISKIRLIGFDEKANAEFVEFEDDESINKEGNVVKDKE